MYIHTSKECYYNPLTYILGKTVKYGRELFFKLKDEVFKGHKPYDEKPLEKILEDEFGKKTVMTDHSTPKLLMFTTLAYRRPAEMHVFRNYNIIHSGSAVATPRSIQFPALHQPQS